MNRIIGLGIGVLYLFIAFGALRRGSAGWDAGMDDLGFWWTVIGLLLLGAAAAALVGTVIHSRQVRE